MDRTYTAPWLVTLFERLSRIEHADPAEARRLSTLQVYYLFSVATMATFVLVYGLLDPVGLLYPLLLSLACVPLYAGGYWLNRRGFHAVSRVYFFVVLAGSVLISTTHFVGRAPGLHFFFLLAAMLPLLVWRLGRVVPIAVTMLCCLGGFAYIQFRPTEELMSAAFPSASLLWFNSVTIIASYAMTLLILILFKRRAEMDAQKLLERTFELEDLMRRYEALSNTDHLTALLNRRAMLARMREEQARMNRQHAAFFSVLMIDLDWFKSINDHNGHDAGDRVLVGVSALLRASVREDDQVARWGGEEFLVLLPDTELERALVVADKIRQRCAEARFDSGGVGLGCTLSIGVASHGTPCTDLEATVRRADEALYAAKAAGRNRVVAAAACAEA